MADGLNQYGHGMFQSIERAEQCGEHFDAKEKRKAIWHASAKINAEAWDNWRRKYNEGGAVSKGTVLRLRSTRGRNHRNCRTHEQIRAVLPLPPLIRRL